MSERAAYDLWERLLEEGNYSPWQGDDCGRTYCAFCYEDDPSHYPDCVYVAVCELLGLELNTGAGL